MSKQNTTANAELEMKLRSTMAAGAPPTDQGKLFGTLLNSTDAHGRPLLRRGTIYVSQNLGLSGIPFARQDKWTGDVQMDPVTYVPLGVWVHLKTEHKAHYANIERHWIPANSGGCLAITLKALDAPETEKKA